MGGESCFDQVFSNGERLSFLPFLNFLCVLLFFPDIFVKVLHHLVLYLLLSMDRGEWAPTYA